MEIYDPEKLKNSFCGKIYLFLFDFYFHLHYSVKCTYLFCPFDFSFLLRQNINKDCIRKYLILLLNGRKICSCIHGNKHNGSCMFDTRKNENFLIIFFSLDFFIEHTDNS